MFSFKRKYQKIRKQLLSNDRIERELQECQQFQKDLSIINQFSGQQLVMHPPNFCFSNLTYPLPVHITQSKQFWKYIQSFCSNNQIRFQFIKEIYQFFVTNSSSTIE